MTTTPEQTPPPLPAPYKFLNYRGDQRAAIGQVMGPTYSGMEVLIVVDATYDEATDRTRLGLTYARYAPEATS